MRSSFKASCDAAVCLPAASVILDGRKGVLKHAVSRPPFGNAPPMRFHPRILFALFAFLCLFLTRIGSTAVSAADQPNFILILADDLGYGDVSFNGPSDVQSPNLDRLASEGMTFTDMRANCTVCSPTRAAIMTGRFADRAGVPGVIRTRPENSWGYLAPEVPTIANRLGDVGYHTAIVGKWHLGLTSPNTPTERGFNHFHGFLGDMMDDYYTHRRRGFNYMRLNRQVIDPEGHATDLFTEWAEAYLRQRANEADKPFFLYLAYNAPHFPIQPPEEWLTRVQQRIPSLSDKRAKAVAFVEHLDDRIGQLMRTIDDLGFRENTIVAFTSDNGGSLNHAQNNSPWRGGKQDHYDGGLKVPFVVRYPGKIEAGSQSDYEGLTFDLTATFLDYAGAARDEHGDAVSLALALSGKSISGDRDLYFVRREGNARYAGHAYHAIIRGQWKLMQNTPFSPLELYNLQEDPQEKNDLISQRGDVVRELKNALSLHIQRGGRIAWQPPLDRP